MLPIPEHLQLLRPAAEGHLHQRHGVLANGNSAQTLLKNEHPSKGCLKEMATESGAITSTWTMNAHECASTSFVEGRR